MKQNTADGNAIYSISRHSNWTASGIEKAFLEAGIYPNKDLWKKFIGIFILVLGVGFLAAGIIFFFAYNWAHLHRFIKLGIIEVLIISTVLVAVFSKLNLLAKNIILTGSSILAGSLFAVFGQVYQTGANAYDFFLGWSIFILLWSIAGAFAPLWLVLLALVNTTIILYHVQVASNWSDGLILSILFVVNVAAALIAEFTSHKQTDILSKWFIRIAGLAALTYSTLGVCNAIFDHVDRWSAVIIILSLVFYALAIVHSLRSKDLFYLATIPLSVIIIGACFIINLTNFDLIFGTLAVFIFISGCITLLIKQMLKLNKSWHGQQITGG